LVEKSKKYFFTVQERALLVMECVAIVSIKHWISLLNYYFLFWSGVGVVENVCGEKGGGEGYKKSFNLKLFSCGIVLQTCWTSYSNISQPLRPLKASFLSQNLSLEGVLV
jgi:hypothetical protein